MAVAIPRREEGTIVPSPVTAAEAAALAADDVLTRLGSGTAGLPEAEAARRLRVTGPNAVRSHQVHAWSVLASQLRSPLLILLAVTALASAFLGQSSDAIIIGVILAASVGLGFVNEYKAAKTAEALHSSVRHRCVVLRDGHPRTVDVTELVPGDVVDLQLGQVVPADLRLLAVAGPECDEQLGPHPGQHAVPGHLRQERRGRLRAASLPGLLLRRRFRRDDDADRDDLVVRHGAGRAGAEPGRQRRHRRGAGRLLGAVPPLAGQHVDLPGLPGQDPGLDLARAVVPVPAHRG